MNKTFRVIETFAGIGAPRKALDNLGINYEIVDAIEIDKYAVKSYNAIYNDNIKEQDIKKWNKTKQEVGEIDLLWNSSPCQDLSMAGKNAGAVEGSGTRSSLVYEVIRIAKDIQPKYIIWENVKGLLTKKNKPILDDYINKLKDIGYNSYYQLLNAKDYGIPQNRERVFTVSILNGDNYEFPKGDECDNSIKVVGNYMPSGHNASRIVDEDGLAPTVKENHGTVTAVLQRFEFPPKQELKLRLKDMLEDEVDEKYYLSEDILKKITNTKHKRFTNNNLQIEPIDYRYDEGLRNRMEVVESYVSKKYSEFEKEKGYVPELFNPYNQKEITDIAPTQTAQCGSTASSATVLLKDNFKIRKLTPKETFRLMGFDDEDFYKAQSTGNSNSQLYKQAGNSICVPVLMAIFKELFKDYIKEK